MFRLEALDVDAVEKAMIKPASWYEARNKGVGGSEAGVIWSGDWLDLFKEKTGRAPPKDLRDELPPMMGTWTEPFNIWWFQRRTGLNVTRQKKALVHPKYRFMRANFDGFVEGGAVLEAKHVHAFTKDETVVSNYYAQAQHLMEVSGTNTCYLSVFFGSARWQDFDIEREQPFIDELIEKERCFWEDYVLQDREPPADVQAGAKVTVAFDEMVEVDLSTSNSFVNLAQGWLDMKDTAARFAEIVDELKILVPLNAKRVFGGGIEIRRAKNNALTIKEIRQ